jgi:hypothetical protein
MMQLSVGGRRKPTSSKLSGLQTPERGDTEKEVADDHQDHNGKDDLFHTYHSRHVVHSGALALLRETEQQVQTHQVAGPATMEPKVPVALTQLEQQKKRSVSYSYKCKQFVAGKNVESNSNGSTADYDRV